MDQLPRFVAGSDAFAASLAAGDLIVPFGQTVTARPDWCIRPKEIVTDPEGNIVWEVYEC